MLNPTTVTIYFLALTEAEYREARANDGSDALATALIDINFGGKDRLATLQTILAEKPDAYKPVATLSVRAEDKEAAELAFTRSQHIEAPWFEHHTVALTPEGRAMNGGRGPRSSMVGDLFLVETGAEKTLYVCDAVGFKEVTGFALPAANVG